MVIIVHFIIGHYLNLSRIYGFKPCIFVQPNFFNMKKHIFDYYIWKNAFFEFFSKMYIHLSSIGEEEVKRRGYEVLSLCEFEYSCCDFYCWLSLATLHSRNTNLVWRSSTSTSWSASLVKWIFLPLQSFFDDDHKNVHQSCF